ncbi:SH3 domain-containing protein [Epilithonimonas ginsengisoli]|uniref:SH3 domain-containing protein n=1 Tax=Epilithonimonas ginsengisoli TaxID=1245592 RepID=A0ABU4JKP3_9FLAO|nr:MULTISPECIES: SH3 domain-containing protein [Chryseobacterium group]MBV6881259.1 SH3 domain-containing protein [Epilithonimonas sp. FP105]MDW8550274.1 SH3 domain-containing protein [Epilithonimonas ginsengisoli]
MRNQFNILLSLIIFFAFTMHSCQSKTETETEKIATKQGIIVPKIDSLKYSEKYCCVLSPEQGFSVYDNPKGKIIGTLKRMGNIKEDNQVPYKIYLVTGDKKVKIENFREISSEIFAINYTDSAEGFVKVVDSSKSYWLSVAEIEKNGFKTVNWRDQMIEQSKGVLGYYANEPGLRLRKEPNSKSEIIGSVRGDLFEIKLTKNISGQWCKVKVTKYKEHPCNTDLEEAENIESQTEGWLKIIDDNGEPNLWSYTRGC